LVDTCYRIGGDEFAIILMNTDVKNARKVADKLRILVEKHEFNINDMNLKITISIGTASSNEIETVKELISLADSRLYDAKEHGRNQIK
jgi:diguanylate cyclase (GGDEF)-like protein